MERLVSEEECFVLNPGLDRQPVKVDAGGGDVLPGLGAREKPGGRALDALEPLQGFAGNPGLDSIAIVEAGGDESMYERFCHRVRE